MNFQYSLMFYLLLTGLHRTRSQTDSELMQLLCLTSTGQELEVYFKTFVSAFQTLPDGRDEFCKVTRKDLTNRIEIIGNDFRDCLDQETEFLADFLKESANEALNFWCHNQGENMIRYFSPENLKCREYIIEIHLKDFQMCFLDLILSKSLLTKSGLCSRITEVKNCFADKIDTFCPENYNFKNLTETYFDYVSRPCSGCANTAKFLVLSVLLAFHLFLNQ